MVIAKLIPVPRVAGIIPGIFHVGQDGFDRMLAPCIFPFGTFNLFALKLLLDAYGACPFQIPVKDVPDDLRRFLIDGKQLFEVGGKGKTFDQIADIPDSYLAVDDTEVGSGNRIPLWLFGFLY